MSTSDADPSADHKPMVVAIGASAGGLSAFESFFKAAPADLGMAFILVPHLDPKRHSLMVDLVGKYTKMPVVQAAHSSRIEVNHVYIIPPNKYLSVRDGMLILEKPIERRGMRMAIDHFFRSLAESERERAICIVLSGTGTDGTQGLKSIKGNGGMTMVQEPATAQYDGMPVSCIHTGMVDFIMPPEAMPGMLRQFARHQLVVPQSDDESESDANSSKIDSILGLIKARTQHDFMTYKRGTIQRRISRRIALLQLADIDEYLQRVRKDSEEVRLLFEDLLIGVTQFFREPEYFEDLDKHVIQHLVSRGGDAPIRVWIPGCSTGEEAYSIAISLIEAAAKVGQHINLQMFATDVDERALSLGRAALYPESIAADVPEALLRRYFVREDHSYRVCKQVREPVVFARQNLISDPPFSKLDLICCRNLLIYLNSDIQYRILSLFSFALNQEGFLFLGGSETVGRASTLFQNIGDKKSRIFKKIKGVPSFDQRPFPVSTVPKLTLPTPIFDQSRGANPEGLTTYVNGILLERFAPAAVVTTSKFEIVQIFGSTGEFLELPAGSPSNELLSLARRGMRIKLKQVISRAFSESRTFSEVARIANGKAKNVVITAKVLKHPRMSETLCLVTFELINEQIDANDPRVVATVGAQDIDENVLAQLETELRSTREELQGTIEELETSNEELKTSNEEAMSMNEELQSTNEELETSKEELQSLNEELSTVNTELQEKLDELEKANDDLGNLLGSTDLATIFLDTAGRIRRFTPSAKRLFKLIASDVGRPINDITCSLKTKMDLIADTEKVLQRLQTIENEVQDNEGQWYIRRVIPYRTGDNRIEGVVVTFSEVTMLKEVQRELEHSEARYRSLYENTPAMYFTLDSDLNILSVNKFGASQLKRKIHELVDESFLELCVEPNYVKDIIGRIFRSQEELQRWEAKMHGGVNATLWTRCLARGVMIDNQLRIFVVVQDITAERKMSDELEYRSTHDYLTGLLNRREFDFMLRSTLEKPTALNTGHSVLYIDMTRFKLVNDTAGHAAGDYVLKGVADLLRKHSRKMDVVARLGGDEFGIIMEYCSAVEASRLAKILVEAIEERDFTWRTQSFSLSCAVGIVEVHDAMLSPEEVLRRADVACYMARDEADGSVRVFDETDVNDVKKRAEMRWGGLIRSALSDDRVNLICEPIVRGKDNEIIGFEFLSRIYEDGLLLDTGALIAAAERYGLAPDFDRHVVKKALTLLAKQLPRLASIELFTINISGQSIGRPDVAESIIKLLANASIPLNKLCFEITETATITNFDNAALFVRRVREFGCRVAIDDFGSGLASFHYLNSIPCDLVKIDGSFVRNMLTDETGMAVVTAIDNIAKLYGVETCAEWVENHAIDAELQRIGVNYRQGYLFGGEYSLHDLLTEVERRAAAKSK